jgi:peroxiredoxin
MKNISSLLFLVIAMSLLSCSESTDPIVGGPDITPDEPMVEGEKAPAFQLETYNGGKLSLADYKDKTLVIFFFGNTCPPCQAVAPKIESDLNKAFGSNNKFAMVGIDQWDGNAASVEGFKDRTGVTFPLGIKGSGVARDFGTTYDRLVVVNPAGNIEYRGTSIAANNLDEVVNIVKTLLK